MPWVVGLLEQHELAARRRVDGLCEEADRIQSELAAAEQEWTIARKRVGVVRSAPGGSSADAVVAGEPIGARTEPEAQASPPVVAKPKSQVPVWREGLAWSVLSVDYQRILQALADRVRLGQGPLTCQEMAMVFAAWRDVGTDQVIHELLRCQVREKARRLEDPTLVVLDTQSVHVAAGVPASTTGLDPAKRVPGHKRGLAVEVLGLVVAVTVLAANTHDNAAGVALLDQVAEHTGGTIRKVLVDQGFKNQVAAHGTRLGIDVETVERNPQETRVVPQPKRWRIEQTYGILVLHRRLVRDHEHRASSSASRVRWAMTHVMVRRLTVCTLPPGATQPARVREHRAPSRSARHPGGRRPVPGRRPPHADRRTDK